MKNTPIQQKYISHIGADFIAADGQRITSFQLCKREETGLKAVASVDFHGDTISRCLVVESLANNRKAIVRLAHRWKARSTPFYAHPR